MNAEAPKRPSADGPSEGEVIADRFSTDEVYRRLVATAEEELRRSSRQLFVSGLAAGLTVSASILARFSVTARLGGDAVAELTGNLLYGLGFVFIMVGRYQLFTENTLTPVTLVLEGRATLRQLLRLWTLVLSANLVGACCIAWIFAHTSVLSPEVHDVALEVGQHGLEASAAEVFWKGIFAGGLIATLVWLGLAVRESTARILLVMLVVYVVPTAGLHHCVFGSEEALYVVFRGHGTWLSFIRFFACAVAGNSVGGIVLVALVNYAQTKSLTLGYRR
ncbi:MAG: formate/nitrite transporter family protein [Polyangiales bacterium]